MKQEHEIIEISVCKDCEHTISIGTISCPGCQKHDPKIKFKQFIKCKEQEQ